MCGGGERRETWDVGIRIRLMLLGKERPIVQMDWIVSVRYPGQISIGRFALQGRAEPGLSPFRKDMIG